MEDKNRRAFLKKSMIGISGTALLSAGFGIKGSGQSHTNATPPLPERRLGKTGITTPLLSMGTSGVTTPALVKAAYEAGIKLFFSATYYGEGNNEILVGKGLQGLPRDSFIVGTAAIPDEMNKREGTLLDGFSAEKFIKKAESSLKRFGLDYIDIVLLPYASKKETVLNEDVLKTFDQLKKQGKVRFVGISSHGGIIEALHAAADSGVYDLAMIAYNFKTGNLEALDRSIDYAARAGMGIVAMKTLAGASHSKSGQEIQTDAAHKWVLRNENIATVVSGMTTFDQLQQNLAMLKNLKMTDEEKKALSLLSGRSSTGLYCQQCKQCLPQCPDHLDIPTIMRSYMYAYGYKNMAQAWHTLAEAGLPEDPCASCASCSVSCASGFDVRNKITDIARLRQVPPDLINV